MVCVCSVFHMHTASGVLSRVCYAYMNTVMSPPAFHKGTFPSQSVSPPANEQKKKNKHRRGSLVTFTPAEANGLLDPRLECSCLLWTELICTLLVFTQPFHLSKKLQRCRERSLRIITHGSFSPFPVCFVPDVLKGDQGRKAVGGVFCF